MDYKQHIKNLLLNNKENVINTNKNKSSIALTMILEEEIDNFDYNGKNDITYIFDLFDTIIILLKNNKNMQTILNDKFIHIHNKIRNILHAFPEKYNKNELSRFRILQNIINKMETSILIIYNENPLNYDANKEEFINYIIFKLKYIAFLQNACEKFPHIVNSIDKDEIPLQEKVLDKYLEALDLYLSKENLGPIDDLIYYDKVLNILFENEKIKIDEYNKKIMLDKIKKFINEKNYSSNRLKEKLSFFINSIINTITGIPNEETLDYLSYKYEIHTNFKESHNLEAKTIYLNTKDIGSITTTRKIYTFDGENACEIDDGISLIHKDGLYKLGVHIADPTAYINSSSILMDEAIRRTTSRYLEDFVIPLYPTILSADRMSLNEGKNTYCMSYYFDIDERTGELINFEIKNEICKIEKNLTYDYYNECIDKGTEDYEFFNFLVDLSNLSEILKQVYNEDLIYQEFHNNKNNSLSTSVVASAMIYTNYNVAKKAQELDIPFIYRCHSINDVDIKKLSDLQDRLKEQTNTLQIVKNIEMIKNMFPRAYYTTKNVGHYGLGINYYSHITSPLRRLADNIAIICIKKFMFKEYSREEKEKMLEFINEIAEQINQKRASGDDYEIQYARIKTKNKTRT